jgi:TRAP-type C4-dicarboxylate transport system permease small subunit
MELSSYMLAIFILLGIAYTHQVRGHVRVTMLVSRLPDKWAIVLDVITTLLSLFIIAVMTWQGWVVGIEERTVSDMLRVPQFPFRLLVSLGGLLLFLELLLDLWDNLKKFARR